MIAWLLAVGECFAAYNYTLLSWQGYHYFDIPKLSVQQKVQAAKYDIANQLLYNPILAVVKTSVIVFLWRLEDRRKSVRLALSALFTFNICLMISIFLADLLQCSPIHYYYDHYRMDTVVDGKVVKKGGTCIMQVNFFLISAGFSVLTDILILLIPAAILQNLRMATKNKIAVWAVMSLGWV